MEPVSNTLPILGFATRSYDAYGYRDLSIDGARTGFAGEVSEAELPWYLLGERFYVPSLRRFISPDAASPFEVGGLNRYAYCSGDPLNRIDPSGEGWFKWALLGIGLAVSVAALVVSGGTLAAAVGAAWVGGAGTITTSSMVTIAVTVALDTVAVVAEIGSIVSEATGDEKAQKIFGYIDTGASVARIALGGGVKLFGKSLKIAEAGAKSLLGARAQIRTYFEFLTDMVLLLEQRLDDSSSSKNSSTEDGPENALIEMRSMRSGSSEAQPDRGGFASARRSSPPADESRTAASSWPGKTEPAHIASDALNQSSNGFENDVRDDHPDRSEFAGLQRENPLSNLPREVERSIVWSRTKHVSRRSDEDASVSRISHPRENVA